MFRAVPFHLKENAERGYDVLEKVLSYAAEQSLNPLGEVSGALSSFKVDVIDNDHINIYYNGTTTELKRIK